MRTLVSLSIFLVFCISLQAQTIVNQYFVHFGYDKHNLTEKEQITLDEIEILHFTTLEKIELTGHTDADGNDEYNIQLSKKRVLAVQEYLVAKGLAVEKISHNYHGESIPVAENATDGGKQKNRRVEITVYTMKPKIEKPITKTYQPTRPRKQVVTIPTPEPTPEAEPKPAAPTDTTFIVDGVEITMTLNDFYKFDGCLEIDPLLSLEEALENNVTTRDREGSALVSGGMIFFKAKDPACEGQCFEKPIIVRILIPDVDCHPCAMSFYGLSSNGSWVRNRKTRVRKKRVQKQRYFEFKVSCMGGINLDCKPSSDKAKFKFPAGYKPISLNVYNECPFYNIPLDVRKHARNPKSAELPCTLGSGAMFKTTVTNAKGDTCIIEDKLISSLKHSRKTKCRDKNRRRRANKVRTGALHKKYKIRKEQFEL